MLNQTETTETMNDIPIEQMLGSVSYNDTEGTQLLRTSARVFKKMKLDMTTQPTTNSSTTTVQPSTSIDISSTPTTTTNITSNTTTTKAKKSIWTCEEKSIFFEALNEYGKDFENIQNYLNTRIKRKCLNEQELKTKEQIRLMYVRTWNTLSKYLKFNDNIPRLVQELYALINYGEVRRKIGFLSKKRYMKCVNGLIHKGDLTLRIKGKTIRLRTPMCKALRRLNQLDDKYDDLKLPSRVHVELIPKNMQTYLHVQNLAQNPRVKLVLSLQKRLFSLINGLNLRWRDNQAINYENYCKTTEFIDCLPEKKSIDENKSILTPLLRIIPPKNIKIQLPTIDMNEYFTRQSICLRAYELRKTILITNDKQHTMMQENDSIVNSSNLMNENFEKNSFIKRINEIRQGWTLDNCEGLTIGELYLMFGDHCKLLLEYCWDDTIYDKYLNKNQQQLNYKLTQLLSLIRMYKNDKDFHTKCTFKKPKLTKTTITTATEEENRKNKENVENLMKIQPITSTSNGQSSHSNMMNLVTQLNSLQKLKPKLLNRRGRKNVTKQFLIERKLPLLPSKLEQDNKHHLVSVNIISQPTIVSTTNQKTENVNDLIINQSVNDLVATNTIGNDCLNDNLSDILIEQSSSCALSTNISTILKENDQWNSENEFSLSSFLGRLESDDKVMNENDDEKQEDKQNEVNFPLHPLMFEASLDYTEKFDDLNGEIVNN